ncbi:hypothetical protein B0J17DRAFT_580882, partial [Rhizoctonia solani]
ASKANFGWPPFITGGNWKKRTCIPPKGFGLFRIMHATLASRSNRSPSNIDTTQVS